MLDRGGARHSLPQLLRTDGGRHTWPDKLESTEHAERSPLGAQTLGGGCVGARAEGDDGNALVSVENGYSDVRVADDPSRPNAGLAHLAELLSLVDPDALRRRLRIGIHSGVEVPFRARDLSTGETDLIPVQERHTVSQAFCSALACGYARGSPEQWEPLARIVLEATYEATLWAAASEQQRGIGSGVVYLTFVGGGVFRNRPEWIEQAIGRACACLRGYPLTVKVCHYCSINPQAQARIDASLRAAAAPSEPL